LSFMTQCGKMEREAGRGFHVTCASADKHYRLRGELSAAGMPQKETKSVHNVRFRPWIFYNALISVLE